MTHPIHTFLSRLERDARRRRTHRDMERVQADPHLARDVGLPFKPAALRKPEQW